MSFISDPLWGAFVRAQSLLTTVMLVGFASACTGAGPPPRTDAIVVQLADAPVERYALTAAFVGLPDTIDAFSGAARFTVANPDCVPLDTERAFGGVRLAPRHLQPLNWRRGADGVHRANVNLDALQDENYFGLGLCRWRFDGLDVRFVVDDAHFVHAIAAEDVRAQRERRGYYLARDIYAPRVDGDVFSEDAGFYRDDLGAQFTLTLAARQEARLE